MSETPIDIQSLSGFVPLNALNHDNLSALLKNAEVIQLAAGQTLFQAGDLDRRSLYLIVGEIELVSPRDKKIETFGAAQDEASHPIAPYQPRQHTAKAITDIEVISFDSVTLDIMLTWDQEAGAYEVEEDNNEDSDWMMRMLNNKAFYDVPPANIHSVFTKMEPLLVKQGETIISQGQGGDFFYAIQSGSCEIIRETPRQSHGIKLVELGPGDTFGEEALIADTPRNATVRMLSDGVLLRLDKKDFVSLLTAPILDQLKLDEAKARVAQGAIWLDVRLPSEFAKMHIKGSINIPLYFLRSKLDGLDHTPYVVVCDSGSRSSAGAFLLKERGFDAAILEGGLNRAGTPRKKP